MCGRFAQALPPRDYFEVVNDQLNGGEGEHRNRKRTAATTTTTTPKTAKRAKESQDAVSGNADGLTEHHVEEEQESMTHRNRKGTATTTSKTAKRAKESQDSVSDNADGLPEHQVEEEQKNTTHTFNFQNQLGEKDYHPTYNVAPGVQVPIVRLEDPIPLSSSASTKQQQQKVIVQSMRWGLLPHHLTQIPRGVDAIKTINARDDAICGGRSMWTPLVEKGKRCIIFVQGFYEWLKKDFEGKQKVAHFVGMQKEGKGRKDFEGNWRELMPLAGLWEVCRIENKDVYSFTIITTDSNKQLNFLHDRMPVILPDQKSMKIWLGINDELNEKEFSQNVFKLLKPFQAGTLDCYPVPGEVGRVGNDNANFILPVSMRKDGIQAAFGKVKEKRKVEDQEDATTETNAPLQEEFQSIAKQPIKSEPSSKYSPEPFNPPLSPQRPRGGYSTIENPDPSPYKRKHVSSPGKGMGAGNSVKKRQLEESAKGSKDIRSFFTKK